MGFLRHDEAARSEVSKEKSNIVVKMLRFLSTGGDLVNVEIEHILVHGFKKSEAGFLKAFPKCHGKNIGISVGMPSRLQPPVQLAMMGEQGPCSSAIENPCRARDVTNPEGTLETFRMIRNKAAETLHRLRLVWMRAGVTPYQIEKNLSVHRKSLQRRNGQR